MFILAVTPVPTVRLPFTIRLLPPLEETVKVPDDASKTRW